MIVLASFVGEKLFSMRNREGLRPIDIADQLRNDECVRTLQTLERNVIYQNAIMNREIKYGYKEPRAKSKYHTARAKRLKS